MSIQQVEIVKPKKSTEDALLEILGSLAVLAFRALIVWWAVTVWFPEAGITYWQIILPVYALRVLILPRPEARLLTK